VTIAVDVALSNAPPTPWTMRLPISQAPFMLSAAASDPSVKMTTPAR